MIEIWPISVSVAAKWKCGTLWSSHYTVWIKCVQNTVKRVYKTLKIAHFVCSKLLTASVKVIYCERLNLFTASV